MKVAWLICALKIIGLFIGLFTVAQASWWCTVWLINFVFNTHYHFMYWQYVGIRFLLMVVKGFFLKGSK